MLKIGLKFKAMGDIMPIPEKNNKTYTYADYLNWPKQGRLRLKLDSTMCYGMLRLASFQVA